jgi:4-carboxymuconolactone decarboxylase
VGERAARLEAEMQSHRCLAGLLVLGIVVAAGPAQRTSGQAASETAAPPVSGRARPADVHPETGNRFPPIRREALNEAERRLYDTRGVTDGFGPAALRLYSPPVAESMTAVNNYLRRKSGLEPRLVELAILVTAREMDAEYVWTSHEPAARKAGLEQAIIDTVKFRRTADALGEKERVIVQFGRDAIGKHKVDSDTFARAVQLFGHQGVVNIASLIGNYAATAILLNIADQHVRDVSLLPVP